MSRLEKISQTERAPRRTVAGAASLAVSVSLYLALSGAAAAMVAHEVDPRMKNAQVTEHLGDFVPVGLEFKDENGATVKLREYWTGERPVLLTLNYYTCTTLCTLILNGLVDGLRGVDFVPGQDFEIVTVSINPRETPERARAKKNSYLSLFDDQPEKRAGAEQSWHFLTGDQAAIDALALAVGFGYQYDEATDQYAHGSAIMFTSPSGKLVRYLGGVAYPSATVKMALLEAAEGKIGTPLENFFLICFHYDALTGKYSPTVFNIMRLAGAVTVILLGMLILCLLWRGPNQPIPSGEIAATTELEIAVASQAVEAASAPLTPSRLEA